MKKITIMATFVVAVLLSLSATAQKATASSAAPTSVTQISGEVTEFYYLLTTGPGKYDHIGVHRVTRVDRNQNPRSSENAVLMVHGDFWPFDQAFVGGISRNSIAAYLASQGVDVWGIDLAWTLVPASETDFSFMKTWGMQHDINDIETALSFARSVRSQTGSGSDRLTLLAWSRGAWFGYGLINQESQQECKSRQVKAYIPVDAFFKTDFPPSQTAYCGIEAYYNQLIASGIYATSTGQLFSQVGQFAVQAPYVTSALFGSPYTNLSASLGFGAASYQLGYSSNTPFFHFLGGSFATADYWTAIPSGFTYSNIGGWNGLLFSATPYAPTLMQADTLAVTCGDDPNLPFDKHLADIKVPVHYVGAGGGFGTSGLYTLSLLGSKDVSSHIVSFYPPEKQVLDFGHTDLFYADNAQQLAWNDILNFVQGQRQPSKNCEER